MGCTMSALRSASSVPVVDRQDVLGAAARLKARDPGKYSRALQLTSLVVEPEVLPEGGGLVTVRWASMDKRIVTIEVAGPGFLDFCPPNGSVQIRVTETCEVVLVIMSTTCVNEYRAKIEVESPAPIKVSWRDPPGQKVNYLFWKAGGIPVERAQLTQWCLEMGAPSRDAAKRFVQMNLVFAWIVDYDEDTKVVTWKPDKFPLFVELDREFSNNKQ